MERIGSNRLKRNRRIFAYFCMICGQNPCGFAAPAMTLRVAINGFGRIGRNVLRGWISRGANTGLEIVGMNSTSDPATSAHLLTYDSILGRLDPSVDIKTTDDAMFINGKEIKFFADRNPLNCPWKEWGVDLVIESTGVFNTDEKASMHMQAGAKKVILTAPGKVIVLAPSWWVSMTINTAMRTGTSSATPAAPPTALLRSSRFWTRTLVSTGV